jgi:cell division protein FtsA
MDTRLGHPSEHLAGNNSIDISSPMYATAVGLVMNSIKIRKVNKLKDETLENDNMELKSEENSKTKKPVSILDQFTERIKTFLDNAE